MSENNPQIVQSQVFPTVAPYAGSGYTYPVAPVAQRRGLGIAALIVAIAVFVISVIWAADNGVAMFNALGNSTGDGFTGGFDAGYDLASTAEGAALSAAVLLHLVLGTVAGVSAIVLGILAIALRRGRAQGVAAVIIAAVAPFVSFIAYTVAGSFAAL